MRLFADMSFLREGSFINIPSGQQFYDGSDMSVLLPDTSADNRFTGVGDGQIWQSAFRQWVYESGVPLDGTNITVPPIQYSGVYIEGAFRKPDDPTFGHVPDYLNGRIIFNQPQPLGLQVHGAFATREIRMGFEHDFNQQYINSYLESKYTTNPGTSMQLVYPSGFAQPFPAVFIEVDTRDFDAYEMGNRSLQILDEVKFHVWALDDLQRDDIVDILTAQMRKVLPIIDFNKAPLPLSGIYNTISPEYVTYQRMLQNPNLITTVGSGYPVRYLTYLDNVESQNLPASEEYERSLVTFRVRTMLNAPNQPIGHVFGPISTIPTIQGSVF
jgi:hypothetical protein